MSAAQVKPKIELPTQEELQRVVDSIRAITDMGKRLTVCGLNERAVITLLHESSGVAKRDIKFVLAHLRTMSNAFLVKP